MAKHIRTLFDQIIYVKSGRFTNILDENTGLFRKLNINEISCNLCKINVVEVQSHLRFIVAALQTKGKF